MSLIADSLKKAVKEKSVPPRWDPGQKVNLVGKRDPLEHPGLWSVFRIGLLVILPTAVLVYLVVTGAFDFDKRKTPQTSAIEAPPLPGAAKAPADSGDLPGSLDENFLKAPEPTKKTPAKESPVLGEKASLHEASPSPQKNETVTKKAPPSYPPKKKVGEKKKTVVSSPLPVEQPAIPTAPKDLPKAPEPEAVKIVTPEVPDKGLAEKAILPAAPPASEPVEAKISKSETAIVAKTPSESVEEEAVRVTPPKPLAKPLVEASPVLESKAVVAEAPPAPQSVVEEKIPVPEIVKIPKTSTKLSEEPLLAEIPSPLSPTIPAIDPAGKEEKSESLAIKVQKEEVASLPSPVLKPEITRTDPARQENVFQNSDFYFNRAVFFQQAKDWQKALDNYGKAEKLDPNNPDTYNNKGVIYKELRQYDQALDEFFRAIFLNPQYAKAYNNIGVVYFMQKNYAEAIRNYLKAIDLNASNLEAFNNLAIIYKKQKDMEKARSVLNRALAMDPDHPGTNYNLAVLYEEIQEITPALHYYRRFIELGTLSYPALVTQVKKHVEVLKPQ